MKAISFSAFSHIVIIVLFSSSHTRETEVGHCLCVSVNDT